MIELAAVGLRTYVAEPDRGRRDWSEEPAARTLVYANRRRLRGLCGRRLMRRRGELIERSFAHLYDTGGMRRTHLRGHPNILKRLRIHAGGFNLGLLLRALLGAGTPRGLQDFGGRAVAAVLDLILIVREPLTVKVVTWCSVSASHHSNCLSSPSSFGDTEIATCAHGLLAFAQR
jgi:transposase